MIVRPMLITKLIALCLGLMNGASAANGKDYTIAAGPHKLFAGCETYEVQEVSVKNSKGQEVALLKDVVVSDFAGPVVVSGRIFWTALKVPSESKKCQVDSEVWTMDLKSKDKKKLGAEWYFVPSPDGKSVAYTCKEDACLLEVDSGQTKMIAKNGAGGRGYADGFKLLKWSNDSSSFWLGSGVLEGWSAIGRYHIGTMQWFKIEEKRFTKLNPERGWLVWTSDPSPLHDELYVEKMKKDGVKLVLCEAMTGREVHIDHAKFGHRFNAEWKESNLLYKSSNKKTVKMTESEIENALKKSSRSCFRSGG